MIGRIYRSFWAKKLVFPITWNFFFYFFKFFPISLLLKILKYSKCMEFRSIRAYFVRNISLIIFPVFILIYHVPPTQKLTKMIFFNKILILTLLKYENIPQTIYIFIFYLFSIRIFHWLFFQHFFTSIMSNLRKN